MSGNKTLPGKIFGLKPTARQNIRFETIRKIRFGTKQWRRLFVVSESQRHCIYIFY